MWVITVFAKDQVKMFEFESEIEAKEKIANMSGNKILSQVVYFNDHFPDTIIS
jgi:hypothetical protein